MQMVWHGTNAFAIKLNIFNIMLLETYCVLGSSTDISVDLSQGLGARAWVTGHSAPGHYVPGHMPQYEQ